MRSLKITLLSIVGLALIGTGFVAAKLVKAMTAAHCNNVPCIHLKVRQMAIESIIAQRGKVPSYLVIGDSITEMADLSPICGRLPINAGISGATTQTFQAEAARFTTLANPDFVVVALGANDALTGQLKNFRDRYEALTTSLPTKKVIIVPVPPSPKIPNVDQVNREIATVGLPGAKPLYKVETLDDGVHLTASSYADWTHSISDAAQASMCN